MKKIALIALFMPFVLLPFNCSKEESGGARPGGGTPTPFDWLIPQSSVLDGGPGKDGIPAIDAPKFISISAVNFLHDDDLVLGYKVGDDVRAYPHPILDWHEIINDEIGSQKIAVTYCPLTGTGIGWDRALNTGVSTFGVSGLLYNTNLIPYDRVTNSNWSQMLLEAVQGPMAGTPIETFQLIETTWATWKAMYPSSQVVSTETGWSRSYGRYPYDDYKTNHNSLFFPVDINDKRLPAKERVLGLINQSKIAKAYRFSHFPETGIGLLNDTFRELNPLVVGSQEYNFMVAFQKPTDLDFEPVQHALPVVMRDTEGNQWNIFGEAVAGPRSGQKLAPVKSFIGYWVAWGTFYQGLSIYN